MLRDGDVIVLFLLIVVILSLMARKWKKSEPRPVVRQSDRPIRGDIPDLLERDGYEVVAAKQRLPLRIQVGDKGYDSRLYADFIARKNGKYYVVILAKAKKSLRLSGAAVRDRFLGHVFAFQAAGVLYIDPDQETVKTIQFEVSGIRYPRRRHLLSHLVMLIVGMLIAIAAG